MSTMEAILERLERLEVENKALRSAVTELSGRQPPGATRTVAPEVSRRQLLNRAGRAVGALGVGTVAALTGLAVSTQPASADNGDALLLGVDTNTATTQTSLMSTTSREALHIDAQHSGATGLKVQTTGSGIGVSVFSPGGIGVLGTSFGDNGVVGFTYAAKYGVLGEVDSGAGSGGAGVRGKHPHGRGGMFSGGKAALKLMPSTASSHPSSGQRGDLVVDKNGRLWFCKSGSNWKQLA